MDTKPGDRIFVKVKGFKVPRGPQDFSLVVSGRFQLNEAGKCSDQTVFDPTFDAATDAEYFPYGPVAGGIGIASICLLIIVCVLKYKYGIDLTPCLVAITSQSEDEE
eukprot:TRINITY_DN613_c0_g1_i1.p1 TRINITY_DN613_c0_g1~~TRINITY_DN613_c0_g1_i1.p1  ORF type:complete len:107 (+),score=13.65 TRINITY_DN613_c0_g1_i1:347-667(+)